MPKSLKKNNKKTLNNAILNSLTHLLPTSMFYFDYISRTIHPNGKFDVLSVCKKVIKRGVNWPALNGIVLFPKNQSINKIEI